MNASIEKPLPYEMDEFWKNSGVGGSKAGQSLSVNSSSILPGGGTLRKTPFGIGGLPLEWIKVQTDVVCGYFQHMEIVAYIAFIANSVSRIKALHTFGTLELYI